MAELTLTLSDTLIQRLRPMSPWVGMLLEISLLGLKTVVIQMAADLVAFLAQGPPTPIGVAAYQASPEAQQRLWRLLAINAAGLLGETEQAELDELEQLEHLVILLKAQAQEQLRGVREMKTEIPIQGGHSPH